MLIFIAKALIVTVCATGGYLIAAKVSVKYVKQFMEDYMNMLEEKDVI